MSVTRAVKRAVPSLLLLVCLTWGALGAFAEWHLRNPSDSDAYLPLSYRIVLHLGYVVFRYGAFVLILGGLAPEAAVLAWLVGLRRRLGAADVPGARRRLGQHLGLFVAVMAMSLGMGVVALVVEHVPMSLYGALFFVLSLVLAQALYEALSLYECVRQADRSALRPRQLGLAALGGMCLQSFGMILIPVWVWWTTRPGSGLPGDGEGAA